MAERVVVKADTRVLDHIVSKGLDGALRELVLRFALKVEGRGKEWIVRLGAVDTGNLLNSIHIRTSWGTSTFKGGQHPISERSNVAVPQPTAGDGFVANIGPGADYGLYVEKGTSKMAARPYLEPALDSVKADFEAAARRALQELGQ